MIPVIALLLVLPGATQSTISPLNTTRWGVEQGLSHNAVHALAQDQTGFVWLGTQDGLDRFDGVAVRSWRAGPEQPELPGSFITALAVDQANTLWIGTRQGAARLAAPWRRVSGAGAEVQPGPVSDIVSTDSGTWIGGARGLFLVPGTDAGQPEQISTDSITALSADGHGGVWAAVRQPDTCSLTHFTASGELRARHDMTPCLGSFLVHPSGRLMLGTSVAWTPGSGQPVPRPDLVARDHDLDASGNLWTAHLGGVHSLAPGQTDARKRWWGKDPAGRHSLSAESLSLLAAASGAIWIGTYDGVYRHDPGAPTFRRPGAGTEQGALLEALAVSSVAQLDDGSLLLGTFGSGLLQWQQATRTLTRHLADGRPCHAYVWGLHVGPESIWIATNGVAQAGTVSLCTASRSDLPITVHPVDRSPPESVRSVIQTDRDTVWLAGHQGIQRLRNGTLETLFDLPSEVVVGDDREVWFWSENMEPPGLARIRGDGVESFALPALDEVHDLLMLDDTVWIGAGAGLIALDPSTRAVRRYRPSSAGAGDVVYSITPDRSGRLWLGTNRGLLGYDPSGARPARLLETEDGTGIREYNRRARFVDHDGQIVLGGMTGVTMFDPASIRDNRWLPPVALTGVSILSSQGERNEPVTSARLRLGPEDSAVTFEFAALNYTRAERNRYRYRLVGYDEAWIDAGHRRSVRYTSLPAGDYRFEVMGANNHGYWNPVPAVLALTQVPPFWATMWFRLLLAALAMTALALAYRMRVRQLLALERVRLRIASDLHDELGSELSGIALAAGMVARGKELQPGQKRRLKQVEQAALGVVQSLRDIVWYVNPEHDHGADLADRMRSLARNLLRDHELDFQVRGEDFPLDMNQRRHLYLFYKEALTNILRHADATRVQIDLDLTGRAVRLRVADNGRGIDPAQRDGTGLGNMRRRAHEIGADFSVRQTPGGGTTIELA